MIEDSRRKEKMFYDLQYGLLDTPDDHVPDDGIGAFLTDWKEVKNYVARAYRKYFACTQHYESLYQVVDALDVLPEAHVAAYKKKEEAYFTTCNSGKDDRKRKVVETVDYVT
jgi:hypothetical protein